MVSPTRSGDPAAEMRERLSLVSREIEGSDKKIKLENIVKSGNNERMDDSEIRRLEDRIDAVNRESQLRLDAVMARIEGKFENISQQGRHMESSISSISQDMKGLRTTLIVTAIASVLAIVGIVFAGQALWAGGFSSGQADRAQVAATASPSPNH